MKRLLALLIVWTLLVVTGTIMSADAQTQTAGANEPQQQPALTQTLLVN